MIITPIQEEMDILVQAFGQRGRVGTEQRIGQLQGPSYHDGRVVLVSGGLGKAQFAAASIPAPQAFSQPHCRVDPPELRLG